MIPSQGEVSISRSYSLESKIAVRECLGGVACRQREVVIVEFCLLH